MRIQPPPRFSWRLISGALLTTALLPGQTLWERRCPPVSPPARTDHAMALDHASGKALLFGGTDTAGWLGDTWLWDGASWVQQQPFAAPSGRRMHAMAGDPGGQRVLLFGGCNTAGDLGDTWAWDGARWAEIVLLFKPSPRHGHAMAYDEANQEVVLFGGTDGAPRNDTWLFRGSWGNTVLPVSPTPRFGHAMAYDAARQQVILFGGENGVALNDTWAWNGTTWAQLQPTTSPPARSGHALVYHPVTQSLLLFGGYDTSSSTLIGDTWEWNGSDWSPVTLPLQPPARRSVAMVAGVGSEVVAFGGFGGQPLGDTWALQRSRPPYALFGSSCGGALTNTLPPLLGQRFEIRVDNLPTQSPGVVLTGASNTVWGPITLPQPLGPIGAPGCTLYVSAEVMVPFNTMTSTSAVFGFTIPSVPALIGASFYNQALVVDPPANTLGITTTNAGVATLQTDPASEIVECFADAVRFDAGSSAGTWVGGAAPGLLGWDGLHGEFDPTLGLKVGPNEFEWNTDNTTIPASNTLSGMTETVTNGVFRFSKMVVPTGVTVRFVGSQPARLYVRGELRVDGVLDLDGESLPEPNGFASIGQPGGSGGAYGGTGGKGGDPGNGTNSPLFDGQNGDPVQIPPTHAYVARAAGTGGQGSVHFPQQNMAPSCTPATCVQPGLRGFFSIQVAAGGGGGGHVTPGGQGAVVQTPNEFSVNQPQFMGPPAPGGQAFNAFPLPATTSVLDHFLVGGSAGGGAGSHPYNSNVITISWHSGGGGGGGGGAVGARIGRTLAVSPAGRISARGGGTQASANNGFGVPGGGGSGGSIIVQCGNPPAQSGLLDVAGGSGGTVNGGFIAMMSKGGDGAPGYVRVEAPGPLPSNPTTWTGLTDPPATAQNIAILQERDLITGSQSLWYPTGAAAPPTWLRYEVEASVNGNTIVYSDDPAVGTLAGPGGPLQFLVQGAQVDPAGVPDPTTVAPWRRHVGTTGAPSLQGDGATGFRFALLFDRSLATSIVVREVRVVLR